MFIKFLKSKYIKHGKQYIKGKGRDGIIQISFILRPTFFERILKIRKNHPNLKELNCIIDAFRPIFKKIILTDYRYEGFPIKSDFYFGLSSTFSKYKHNPANTIIYSTGSSREFQTKSIMQEISHIKEKFSDIPDFKRLFRYPDQKEIDLDRSIKKMYLIGNEATAGTFNLHQDQIRLLPGISLSYPRRKISQKINRTEVLWMGSQGILHKGLHIVAEVCERLNLKLIAVGISRAELYQANLCLNKFAIEYQIIPWIDVGSIEWFELTENVSFVLAASLSEGMSTSLITCASRGLIPVSTKTCGIDYGYVCEFYPRDSLVERLSDLLTDAFKNPDQKLNELADCLVKNVDQLNTINSFRDKLSNYLKIDITNTPTQI